MGAGMTSETVNPTAAPVVYATWGEGDPGWPGQRPLPAPGSGQCFPGVDGTGLMWLLTRPPAAEGETGLSAEEFRRRVFELAPGVTAEPSPYVLSVRLHVPDPSQREDVRRWLDEEHSERQLSVDGAYWYGGYESLPDAQDFVFLNLWGLESPEVIDAPEWAVARDTPWRERLLESAIVHTDRAMYSR